MNMPNSHPDRRRFIGKSMASAAAVFGGMSSSKSGLAIEKHSPPILNGVVYTNQKSAVGPGAARVAFDEGRLNSRQIENNYLIYYEAQSLPARSYNSRGINYLKSRCRRVRTLATTRFDLFFTTDRENPLRQSEYKFKGPHWQFMGRNASGVSVKHPPKTAAAKSMTQIPQSFEANPRNPSSRETQFVESVMERAGWRFLNNQAGPWGFGQPYEPRVNPKKKTVWYNQQKMNLKNPDWQKSVTNFLVEFEKFSKSDGLFFQFVKPQHYGNKAQTGPPDNSQSNLLGWAVSGRWDFRKNIPDITNGKKFIAFDELDETVLDWFEGLERMFWMLMEKKQGIMVVDFNYFGIPVWRYVRQLVNEVSVRVKITKGAAIKNFYDRIERIGNAADLVLFDSNLRPASRSPEYQLPAGFGSRFKLGRALNV